MTWERKFALPWIDFEDMRLYIEHAAKLHNIHSISRINILYYPHFTKMLKCGHFSTFVSIVSRLFADQLGLPDNAFSINHGFFLVWDIILCICIQERKMQCPHFKEIQKCGHFACSDASCLFRCILSGLRYSLCSDISGISDVTISLILHPNAVIMI